MRLALVLALLWWCAEEGDTTPPAVISDAAMEAATQWVADYAMPMAERTFGDAACSQADRNITTLARWVREEGQGRITEIHVRTMQREVRLAGLTDADAIHAACKGLADAGWVLAEQGEVGFQKRPRAAYRINPALWPALARLSS